MFSLGDFISGWHTRLFEASVYEAVRVEARSPCYGVAVQSPRRGATNIHYGYLFVYFVVKRLSAVNGARLAVDTFLKQCSERIKWWTELCELLHFLSFYSYLCV